MNQHNTRDARFNNSEKKLMAKMKFPEEFATKVGPPRHGAPKKRRVDPWLVAALFLGVLFARWWEPRAKPWQAPRGVRVTQGHGSDALPHVAKTLCTMIGVRGHDRLGHLTHISSCKRGCAQPAACGHGGKFEVNQSWGQHGAAECSCHRHRNCGRSLLPTVTLRIVSKGR